MAGSIATGTGTAATVAAKTAGGGEIGTTKARSPYDTTAGEIGTGAEVAIQNVTGETDATIPRTAGVAALITDGEPSPGTEMVTDTAAGLLTPGGALVRIAEVKDNSPL